MKTDPNNAQRNTDTGFHPPMPNDAPATRGMMLIILFLLVVGTIIAVFAYKRYNSDPKFPEPTEQPTPPLAP